MAKGALQTGDAGSASDQTGRTIAAEPAGSPHRVVIVGGGAGGLELATRLGDRTGASGRTTVTLIDRSPTHLWKPLLHEVAAGSMDPERHALDYLAQSYWHHFRFRLGEMVGLDRANRRVLVGPTYDDEGKLVTPGQGVGYDTLVIAIGGRSNDFGTPGARQYALSLDSPEEAARFNRRMLNACLRGHSQADPVRPEQLHAVIIGAGATGVELAAELHRTTRALVAYGLDRIDPDKDLRITLIEAADRILPALPQRLSSAAEALLRGLGVTVLTGGKVNEVRPDGVVMSDGRIIGSELVVWAAGVKAADFLQGIDGLETNRVNQLVLTPTLQTTRDPAIFALGDCASVPWLGKAGTVPPRAQAAHQQASFLYRQLARKVAGKSLDAFRYRDFGSLISLGEYSTVGNLMGGLIGGSLTIEGAVARIMYLSLYKMHERALHGTLKMLLNSLSRALVRRSEPHVKLH